MAKVSDYQLAMTRNRSGTLTHIEVVEKDSRDVAASFGPEDIDSLLGSARDIDNADPYAPQLPSDESIIRAALGDDIAEEC